MTALAPRSTSSTPPERTKPRLRQTASSVSCGFSQNCSSPYLFKNASSKCVCMNAMNSCASSTRSRMSSLTEPMNASLSALSPSSNDGGRVPGVSKSSIPDDSVTHCLPRVTPALLPVTVFFAPQRLLMSVDLPVLGTPTTIARTVFRTPLRRYFSITGALSSLSFAINLSR